MKYRRLERIKTRINRNHNKIEQVRRNRLDLPFALFVRLMPYMTEGTIKALAFVPTPKKFCKAEIPQDLQLVSFGLLTRLQGAPVKDNYLQTCCNLVSVLTGIPADVVAGKKAVDVLGVVNMCQSEMRRIGKLFNSLQKEKTSDEVLAGIERLDFGVFGLVDWYAKRMNIIDHEEVFNTPWVRIFQCMKIDVENNEFERRYREILINRSKAKK